MKTKNLLIAMSFLMCFSCGKLANVLPAKEKDGFFINGEALVIDDSSASDYLSTVCAKSGKIGTFLLEGTSSSGEKYNLAVFNLDTKQGDNRLADYSLTTCQVMASLSKEVSSTKSVFWNPAANAVLTIKNGEYILSETTFTAAYNSGMPNLKVSARGKILNNFLFKDLDKVQKISSQLQ